MTATDRSADLETSRSERTPPLLEAVGLSKHFPIARAGFRKPRRHLTAVENVNFSVSHGETLAIVGESGCGKTTTARIVAMLETPTHGAVRLDGRDVGALHGEAYRHERRRVQMVFQDPMASLDPRMRVRNSIAEPLAVSGVPRQERDRRVDELLEQVGLDVQLAYKFPHTLSGGQRQRIGIARALALNPDVIVADEPTSALDLSIRAQVVNLLRRIQREMNIAILFISHDLSTVRHLADRVAVMYLGRIVEEGPTEQLFRNPLHPYTRALISAVPIPDPAAERERTWKVPEGDVPDPVNPPVGCAFHTRCPHATDTCLTRPQLVELRPTRHVACHYAEQWIGTKSG